MARDDDKSGSSTPPAKAPVLYASPETRAQIADIMQDDNLATLADHDTIVITPQDINAPGSPFAGMNERYPDQQKRTEAFFAAIPTFLRQIGVPADNQVLKNPDAETQSRLRQTFAHAANKTFGDFTMPLAGGKASIINADLLDKTSPSGLSGLPTAMLTGLPKVPDAEWQRLALDHEASHARNGQKLSDGTAPHDRLDISYLEGVADAGMLTSYFKQRAAQPDVAAKVAKAYGDLRIIGGVTLSKNLFAGMKGFSDHAASVGFTLDDTSVKVRSPSAAASDAAAILAINLRSDYLIGLQATPSTSLETDASHRMMSVIHGMDASTKDPLLRYAAIKSLYDHGVFDAHPEEHSVAKEYLAAFQRCAPDAAVSSPVQKFLKDSEADAAALKQDKVLNKDVAEARAGFLQDKVKTNNSQGGPAAP